jgi:type I restriction enzyme, R subunit
MDSRKTMWNAKRHDDGSSPHARGTCSLDGNNREGKRFIPACAGNAATVKPLQPNVTVHPRMRGERPWRQVLAKRSLADIIENFAGIIEERDARGRITARKPIFPRYHQLDVVRSLCANATERGAGKRYLIQHSAGSGKSNSIAWTVHKLVGLERAGASVFDTVIVVTDRQALDKNLKDTIGDFAQSARLMGHAERSGDLRNFIESGKKVVVTTVQKFPFILDGIGSTHRFGPGQHHKSG